MTESLQSKAERDIAAILAKLESDTGEIVENIDLSVVEVTTMEDDRPQLKLSVVIELKRLPGAKWST